MLLIIIFLKTIINNANIDVYDEIVIMLYIQLKSQLSRRYININGLAWQELQHLTLYQDIVLDHNIALYNNMLEYVLFSDSRHYGFLFPESNTFHWLFYLLYLPLFNDFNVFLADEIRV